MNQCADIASTARGRGRVFPSSRHASVKRLRSSVFMGLPCPMKTAGILAASLIVYRSLAKCENQAYGIGSASHALPAATIDQYRSNIHISICPAIWMKLVAVGQGILSASSVNDVCFRCKPCSGITDDRKDERRHVFSAAFFLVSTYCVHSIWDQGYRIKVGALCAFR